MTEPSRQTREQAQIQLILDEFGDACEVYPPDWRTAENGAQFISRTNFMLVRDRDLPTVRRAADPHRRSRCHGGHRWLRTVASHQRALSRRGVEGESGGYGGDRSDTGWDRQRH